MTIESDSPPDRICIVDDITDNSRENNNINYPLLPEHEVNKRTHCETCHRRFPLDKREIINRIGRAIPIVIMGGMTIVLAIFAIGMIIMACIEKGVFVTIGGLIAIFVCGCTLFICRAVLSFYFSYLERKYTFYDFLTGKCLAGECFKDQI
jgi:hypothetical protein